MTANNNNKSRGSGASTAETLPRFDVIWRHLKNYRHYLIYGGVSVALAAIFSVVRPYLIKIMLDQMEAGELAYYGLPLAGTFIGLTIVSGIFLYMNRRTIIWMSRKLEYDIRGDLFGKLLRLPMSFYHERRIGDIMARLTNDVEAVRMMCGPAVMYFANTIVTTILAVSIMLYMAPKLTLFIIIPMPIISFLVFKVGSIIHRKYNAIQAQFSVLTAAAQENLSGIRVVKAYSQEPAEIEKFEGIGKDYVRLNMDLAKFNGVFQPLLFSVGGLITLIALYVGGREVIAGNLTKGTVVSFFVYIAMLFWPIIALGWVVSLYQRGAASLDRINTILREMAEWEETQADVDQTNGHHTPIETVRGEIEFKNLTFAYHPSTPGAEPVDVLKNITIKIAPGETIGVIGPVGSGKSTLTALITRLYNPPRGTLFIDGRDVNDLPLPTLRKVIGYVPQESFLFSDYLRENIRFGSKAASDDLIIRATERAALDSDIAEFPRGYDTIVGERGITLSGGQKQRLSIARALIVDPKIIILDDATSAVDTETDSRIKRALREELTGRTEIIISHRISSVKDADRIIYLKNGEIAELGSHDELIRAGGEYAELNRLQSLEEELAAQ